MRKIRPQKQRFSIRKFTVGAASVLIGLTFIGVNNQEVQADTTVAPEESVKVESSTISDITETIDNVVNTEDQSVSTANQAEAMSVEENNEVENDVTASGETGNEEVKIDQSISSVETNNVEGSATNEVVTYNAASTNEDTAVNNQNTNTTKTNLVENTTPVEEVQSKASVTIQGTDAEKYPKEAGKLIGKDKYIYQILNLNYTSFRPSQNKKLVLSVNRNSLSDENLYAYVTDNGFTKLLSTHTIQAGHFKNIEVNNGMYNVEFLIVNSGKSDVTVNENKTPVGNASTVVGSTRIEYCLGNSTDIDASSIGEIIPIYTEQSVIKYYYRNKDGKLVEIPSTDKYPNVNVSGWTGQEFVVDNVDQYKQLIDGFYLDDSNIPTGSFTGTLSQFGDGSYYKKVYYSAGYKDEGTIDQLKVDFTVVYRQIDATGKMEVLMYDGSNMPKVIESHTVEAGKSVNFFYNNYTARNPFVTDSAHEVQFVYKELGSLILVDENGKELRAPIKFNNDPTKAGLTSAPIIEGYIADIEYVVPEDTGKDITVIYTANAAKAEIIYVDETTGKQLETAVVDGKYNETINYSTADKIKYYESLGYELVKDGYVGGELGEDTKTFYVTFKHGAVIVTPDDKFTEEDPINPDNPDGLKYPFDSIALDKTITRTIKYVYADGTKAKNDVVQKLRFRGTAIIDKVTGEVIILDENGRKISDGIKWTALDGTTFIQVISPDIAGYTPDRKEIGSLENIDSNTDDIIETVVYNKDIVDPVDPEEPKDPVDSEEPKDPVDPEEPKDPVDPVQAETLTESTNDAPIPPEQATINKVETVENKESGKVEAVTTEDVALPQTGHKHSNAGIIGLGLATIASILGLAGTRKRKKV